MNKVEGEFQGQDCPVRGAGGPSEPLSSFSWNLPFGFSPSERGGVHISLFFCVSVCDPHLPGLNTLFPSVFIWSQGPVDPEPFQGSPVSCQRNFCLS